MVKVGIPRALSYYRHFPFWKTLLEGLGAEVIVSRQTGRRLLEEGTMHCVDDICVPVKLYYGHVLDLKDSVDRVFVSRMVSVEKRDCDTYTCPKLIGLPDMIKNSFDDLPPIVDFVVDVQNRSLKKSAGRLAAQLGAPRSSVRKSLAAALEVERSYQRELLRGLDPESAMKVVLPATDNGNRAGSGPAGQQGEATGHPLRRLESRDNRFPGRLSFPSGAAEGKRGNINIALVGHEYLIHDPFISHNLPARLERLGANVILMTQVAPEVIERELKRYPDISWSYEKELLGAASHFLGREEVDGVMMVMGFACGPDSIISEIIIREVRREDSPPFTTLVLDEHTGVAGVNTRVEAFVDLIRRSGSRT